MIKDAIAKLADRTNLSEQEAEEVLSEIMDGVATPAQIAAYLMGLRQKGETVDEIAGSARAMRARATRIQVGSSIVLDTCGTGVTAGIPSIFRRPRRLWWQVRDSPWQNTETGRCRPGRGVRMC